MIILVQEIIYLPRWDLYLIRGNYKCNVTDALPGTFPVHPETEDLTQASHHWLFLFMKINIFSDWSCCDSLWVFVMVCHQWSVFSPTPSPKASFQSDVRQTEWKDPAYRLWGLFWGKALYLDMTFSVILHILWWNRNYSVSQDKLTLESNPGQALWLSFEPPFTYRQGENNSHLSWKYVLGISWPLEQAKKR